MLILNAESIATLRAALSHFRGWPEAFALFQELLQEPLLQRRARAAGESLAKEYERAVFE
ncbi:MAG: hypothetical protein FJ030_10380 [Chloroflexi bacterium]|nr:hypothetical protein [Chloroflexota bacterium]